MLRLLLLLRLLLRLLLQLPYSAGGTRPPARRTAPRSNCNHGYQRRGHYASTCRPEARRARRRAARHGTLGKVTVDFPLRPDTAWARDGSVNCLPDKGNTWKAEPHLPRGEARKV